MLYSRPFQSPPTPFPLAGVDTETTLFSEPVYDARRKTRIQAPDVPEIIVGSIAFDGQVEVLRPAAFFERLRLLLRDRVHLVFHNVSYDFSVIDKADKDLGSLLIEAVDAGRMHDTAVMECLIQIARGAGTVDEKVVKYVSLDKLAARRAGMKLCKDDGIRLGFGAYKDPRVPVPIEYLEYAADDPVATLLSYLHQRREADQYKNPTNCRYPVYPDAEERYGLLTETIQVKGALGLDWLQRFPVRVDLEQLEKYRDTYRKEFFVLQEALIEWGFAKRSPKVKKFSVKNKELRAKLDVYCKERGIIPPYSSSGLLSLTEKFWSAVLTKLTPAQAADPSSATTLESRLSFWLRFTHTRKILGTYLDTYATSEQHYPTYYNLGARTGRSSASKPSIQQIPLRRDSLRKMFLPDPGCTLIEADFKAAELVCLAEVYQAMFGGSPLGDAINSGEDPHTATARRLVGAETWNSADQTQQEVWRQMAKAIGFGLPGGLGARRFVDYLKGYGITMTVDEARDLRGKALEADPALAAYLSDRESPGDRLRLAARNLLISYESLITYLGAWRSEDDGLVHERLAMSRLAKWARGDSRFEIPAPPGFDPAFDLSRSDTRSLTGRVRGRTSYTQSKNTPFQSLTADAIKLSVWRLQKAYRADPVGWRPGQQVHDSALVHAEAGYEDKAARILSDSMLEGMREVCRTVKVGVKVSKPLPTWGG